MTSPEALVRGLLEPLLDARRQPATEHFDEALAAALAAGRLTPELARELRFWQRASVHEVTDHVRTVVPAVLPVALTAVAEAGLEADQAAAGALVAWDARREVAPLVDDDPVARPTEAMYGDTAAMREGRTADATAADQTGPDEDSDTSSKLAPDPASDDASASDSGPGPSDDDQGRGPGHPETPVSTSPQDGAAMSPHVRRRLFVAGLTSTA